MTSDIYPDERLKLVFTCCHPALSQEAQIALTLKTLGGLKTRQIARAFLVVETSMAQCIVRAKRKIKATNIPFKTPEKREGHSRLFSVLTVIYLIFNEGYQSSQNSELSDIDLLEESIDLAGMLMRLVKDDPEVVGLYALILLLDARRPARMD